MVLLDRFPALAGLDFNASAGESVLLTGPNGAGKTTLLRLCAGLHRLDGGAGSVLGHDLATERPEIRRRVALVGHRTMLYEDLTVAENLRFWGRAGGVDDDVVALTARRLGVEARLHDVPASRLSAGQRRRVALTVAAARRPELWLLDEPHAGLDQRGRDVVDELIGQATAAGATVLVASHELDRVASVVTRQVTISGGSATPAEASEVAGAQ